jgi:small-conductance mechanosensitive channel
VIDDMTLDTILYHNRLAYWLIALGLGVGSWLLLLALRRFAVVRLTTFANRTKTSWDDLVVDLLGRTKPFFLLTLAIVTGAHVLALPPQVSRALRTLAVLVFLWQAGIWSSAAARAVLERYRQERLEADRGAATMIGALGFMVQMGLWSAVVLMALDNLGVNITALVAGLGVGGVAVALAVQNILGDLFASLAIVLDKPFVLGDFIIVADLLGTVEHIGLKTTRVRALSGEQLVFSNADLLSSRIRNFGRMYERRVVFQIDVTYQTPRGKLEAIPGIIRDAITAQDGVRFDRSHFAGYGDFSLNFESVYYVLSPDYNRYMDIQQAINLRIHQRFEAEEIEFAYPTQTLFLARA